MPGNAIQVGLMDGAVRVKSSSIVVAGGADGCCCATPGCVFCAGTVPDTIEQTLSGITVNYCLNGNFNDSKVTGDPNGTYTLTRGSGNLACFWLYREYPAVTCRLTLYTSFSGCAAGAMEPSDQEFVIALIKNSATTASLFVGLLPHSGFGSIEDTVNGYQPYASIFGAISTTAVNDCVTTKTVDNDLTGPEQAEGYGGTGIIFGSAACPINCVTDCQNYRFTFSDGKSIELQVINGPQCFQNNAVHSDFENGYLLCGSPPSGCTDPGTAFWKLHVTSDPLVNKHAYWCGVPLANGSLSLDPAHWQKHFEDTNPDFQYVHSLVSIEGIGCS